MLKLVIKHKIMENNNGKINLVLRDSWKRQDSIENMLRKFLLNNKKMLT